MDDALENARRVQDNFARFQEDANRVFAGREQRAAEEKEEAQKIANEANLIATKARQLFDELKESCTESETVRLTYKAATGEVITVSAVRPYNNDNTTLIIRGTNEMGQEVAVIQHVATFQLTMTCVPKESDEAQ